MHKPRSIYIYMHLENQSSCEQSTGAAVICSQHALKSSGSLQKLLIVTIKKYFDSTSTV